MRYLLDTCLISELVRPKPHAGVVRWLDSRDEHTLYLSVLTIGELRKGISKLQDGDRKEALKEWVDNALADRFEGRILPVDLDVASAWGELQGEAESRVTKLPVMDSLIAATAQVHNLEVVTRNVRDLERCGARVFNPWEGKC
ncbi:MAG: type II toxin-antitoxin system VapC family toxin [Geobacter sp.]|nr:type II toxin-antitoxin system VapC family toxin [Geobacter sp.]